MLNSFARLFITSLAAVCTVRATGLPSLTEFAENASTELTKAPTLAALHAAADAFISQNVSIIINGAQVSRDAFLQDFAENQPGRINTSNFTTFISAIAFPLNNGPIQAGLVGLTLITRNIYANRSLIETSSNNVLVEIDPSIVVPPYGGKNIDPRRVTAINSITIVD